MQRREVKNGVRELVLVSESLPDASEKAESSISEMPLWLTVTMVAKRLSLGKTTIYELINAEDLPVVRVGRAVRVPTARFLKWVEDFEQRMMSA